MDQSMLSHWGLLLLRIISGGGMLIAHGYPKLVRLLQGEVAGFKDPFNLGETVSLGLAVFAEVFCAILVIIGFKTRLALIPLIITMVVAFFVIHSGDPFKQKELAFIYLAMYMTLFMTGPGWYSLDKQFNKLG
jgi:putative oxidoreductase